MGITDLSAHWVKEKKGKEFILCCQHCFPFKSISDQKWPQSGTTAPFLHLGTLRPTVLPLQKCSAYAKLGAEKWVASLCRQVFVTELKPELFHCSVTNSGNAQQTACLKSSIALIPCSFPWTFWCRRYYLMQPIWRHCLPLQIKPLHISQKIIIIFKKAYENSIFHRKRRNVNENYF